MELELGQLVSHYRLVRKLGEGGMGAVYQATDTRLNRQVAIKVLRSAKSGDPRGRQRFLQEARSASALSHPNIVTIHDIFSEEGSDYLVMEYINGKTLGEFITPGGMKPAKLMEVAVQIADALAAAHEASIVHRDLKPGNIMITDAGVVKLVDFGLAKSVLVDPSSDDTATQTAVAAPLTVVGTVMGTAKYMSPEQAQGLAVDARSDVFTFGVVLYEMATGQSAFKATTTMSTLAAVMRDEPRPVAELTDSVPAQLPALIERTMRKAPEDRPVNMREVHRELVRLRALGESGGWAPQTVGVVQDAETVTMVLPAAGAAAPAAAAAKAAPAKPGAKKSNALIWIAAGLAIAGVALGVYFTKVRQAAQEQAAIEQAQLEPPPAPVEAPPVAEPAPAEPVGAAPQQSASQAKPEANASRQSSKSAKSATKGSVSNLPSAAATPEPAASSSASHPPPASAPAPTPTETVSSTPPPPDSPKATAVFAANLADGIPIPLILDRDVRADVAAGETITLRASGDLMIGDLLVIRKGAVARGVVAAAGEKKFLRDTKATMRMESIEAIDGQQVKIRESVGKDRKPRSLEPSSKDARSKDKAILAPKGTEFIGYVDGGAVVKARKNGAR
jgi:serine/threonine-protein kinase